MQLPIDHVAIALPSIAAALPVYELLTGATGSTPEHVADQRVNVSFMNGAGCRLELLEPAGPDSPIERFLARRGAGLHHIAYRVADVAEALARLKKAGIRLIDEKPRIGVHGRRIAFVHPSGMHGVLVELVEANGD